MVREWRQPCLSRCTTLYLASIEDTFFLSKPEHVLQYSDGTDQDKAELHVVRAILCYRHFSTVFKLFCFIWASLGTDYNPDIAW